jgi:ribosomal protein S18 acetylase RimI-like enzyme/mannose-6-phosphate isomerase-like protein (cupin superfamily)
MSGDVVWMPGGVRTEIRLGAERTGGTFCLLVDEPPAGWRLPAHRHLGESETIQVLEGEFEMDIAGERSLLRAGDTIHVPAGVVHAGGNVGQQTGRRLVIFHPAGVEGFFREVGAESPSDPMDAVAVLDSAARHGWEFASAGSADPEADVAPVIRPARLADIDEVLALWTAAYDSGPARQADDRESVGRLIDGRAGAGCLLVAEEAGRVVGTVILGWDGWRGNVYRLAVAPARRRLGIARRLVAAAEAQLRARGSRKVSALVARDDPVAVAVWSAAGYDEEPLTGRFVREL